MSQEQLLQQLSELTSALRAHQAPAPPASAGIPPDLLQQFLAARMQGVTPSESSPPQPSDGQLDAQLDALEKRFGDILQATFERLSSVIVQLEQRLTALENVAAAEPAPPKANTSLVHELSNQRPPEREIDTSTTTDSSNSTQQSRARKKRKKGKP